MAHGTAPQLAQEHKQDQATDLSSAELGVPHSPKAEPTISPSQEQPAPSPSTLHSNSLEQASLASTYDSKLVAKKKKALEQQASNTKIETKTHTDVNRKDAGQKKSLSARQAKGKERVFVPNDPGNIIDRLITHIANLIKSAERWLIKKLSGPEPKKKVVLAKKPEPEDEKLDAFEGRLRKKRKKSSLP